MCARKAATSYCLDTRTAAGGSTGFARRPWLRPPAWLDIALKETLPASSFRCLPSASFPPLEREQALATLKRACARVIAAPEGAQEHTRHRECFNIGGMIGRGELDYATALTALVAAARAMPTYRDPWRNLDERVARSIKAGMVRLLFS
jgi:hypothetical protein